MPLPLTVSCFSKIQIGLTFLVPTHPGSPGQRAVKWVCVCLSIYHNISKSQPIKVIYYKQFVVISTLKSDLLWLNELPRKRPGIWRYLGTCQPPVDLCLTSR